MAFRLLALFLAASTLAGCASTRETNPSRTANEQMLISSAADRAAAQLTLPIPAGSRVFVDATNFEGIDAKYAIGAIRAHLGKAGARLTDDRQSADMIVEIRAGALSIDQEKILLGIPEISVPIPLAGTLGIPEIALFKKDERRGVAKFAALGYSAKDGTFAGATEPQYGFSHQTDYVALLFFSWNTEDVVPEAEKGPLFGITQPFALQP
jgi:hypothetical protein